MKSWQPSTDLILEIFRLNGSLLESGNRLVADIGLTSARWQVLGAIGLSAAPSTVSQIARTMGLSRQAVQRLVNEMTKDRLVSLGTNPQHRRARLVSLTPLGRDLLEKALDREQPWVAELFAQVTATQVEAALKLVRHLRTRLEVMEQKEKDQR